MSTLGGGSLGLYRYICKDETCKAEWQQVPLHKLACGERPNPIMKKERKKRTAAKAEQPTPTSTHLSTAATVHHDPLCGAVGDLLIGIEDLSPAAQPCR